MTVEDMCGWVEVPCSIPTEVRRDIMAALKAAQAMHKGYIILERQARQCGFLDSADHEKLLKAWEVATEKT